MTMNFPVSLGMRRVLPAVALVSAIAALTGCVVAPAYPVVPQGEVVYAPGPPPPLRTEVIPVAPSPVHVWINGYPRNGSWMRPSVP